MIPTAHCDLLKWLVLHVQNPKTFSSVYDKEKQQILTSSKLEPESLSWSYLLEKLRKGLVNPQKGIQLIQQSLQLYVDPKF